VRSELVYMLVKLDKEHTASSGVEPWPEFYATRLLERFSASTES
jgi:hypothetical protein